MTDAQTFAQPPRFVDVKSKRADSQTMCGRATAAKPSPALPSSRQTPHRACRSITIACPSPSIFCLVVAAL